MVPSFAWLLRCRCVAHCNVLSVARQSVEMGFCTYFQFDKTRLMPKETLRYTRDDLTVIWKPNQCIHSTICWKGLIEVFNPRLRPWVNMEGASAESIIAQVKKCPSGALSYEMNQAKAKDEIGAAANIVDIEVLKNGPILIKTECVIKHSDGKEEKKSGATALCRCGQSSNKPYCDGTHNNVNFQG